MAVYFLNELVKLRSLIARVKLPMLEVVSQKRLTDL